MTTLKDREDELKKHLKSIELDEKGHYTRPSEAHDIHERLEEIQEFKTLLNDRIKELNDKHADYMIYYWQHHLDGTDINTDDGEGWPGEMETFLARLDNSNIRWNLPKNQVNNSGDNGVKSIQLIQEILGDVKE